MEVFRGQFPLRSIAGGAVLGESNMRMHNIIRCNILRIDLIACFLKSREDEGVSHCWLRCKCGLSVTYFMGNFVREAEDVLSSIPPLPSSMLWASYNFQNGYFFPTSGMALQIHDSIHEHTDKRECVCFHEKHLHVNCFLFFDLPLSASSID